MINCQNPVGYPLDPIMLGLAIRNGTDIMAKAYDGREMEVFSDYTKLLATTEDDSLQVVFLDSMDDYESQRKRAGSNLIKFKPQYVYLVDFVMRLDFLKNPEFKKTFNFMSKYKFKKREVKIYDQKLQNYRNETVFIPEIQIEELFAFTKNYGVLIGDEEKYIPIVDQQSFELATNYLMDFFAFAADKNAARGQDEICEVSSTSFYDFQDIPASAFQKCEITKSKSKIFSSH